MKTMYLIVSIFICFIVFSETNTTTINQGSLTENYKIDSVKYKTGKRIFRRNCSICHGFDKKIVGNPLDSIWRKYKAGWIYNYLSDDEAFSAVDSTAARINTIRNGEAVYSHRFKHEISRESFHTLFYFIKTKSRKT